MFVSGGYRLTIREGVMRKHVKPVIPLRLEPPATLKEQVLARSVHLDDLAVVKADRAAYLPVPAGQSLRNISGEIGIWGHDPSQSNASSTRQGASQPSTFIRSF